MKHFITFPITLSMLSPLAALAAPAAVQDQPLVTDQWTADPSAHVFDGQIWLYPSHDFDSGVTPNQAGDHFAMNDYHVFSMGSVQGPVTDHGVILKVEDVPWASRQLWAPDVAFKDGKYFLYFPARDKESLWRIGVAVSDTPAGPFKADKDFIPGTFSTDPASFVDTDGSAYLVWGGLAGAQLQCWQDKKTFDDSWSGDREPPTGANALSPQVARISNNMHTLTETARDLVILAPETGKQILSEDKDRRFFEGAWMHKYNDKYYLTYSTGTTHYLVYAVGDSPYGPFTYRGRILEPVIGWTTHASIVEHQSHWYLFYHDSGTSGKDYLRQVKVKEIWYDSAGDIKLTQP